MKSKSFLIYFLFSILDTKSKLNNISTPITSILKPTTSTNTPSEIPSNENNNCCDNIIDTSETLDLGDLDLSRLRLTKQDLETLSSITPGLPKHCQDQLLAQLPPNQARKLSRTLSMQNNSQTAPTKIYKRSLSSGRESSTNTHYSQTRGIDFSAPNYTGKLQDTKLLKDDDQFERNAVTRRSLSKSKASRSSSRCVSSDDFNGGSSLRSSYSSDIGDKYKSCNPSSLSTESNSLTYDKSNKLDFNRSTSPYKYYEAVTLRTSCMSPTKDYYGRPPSGCISPPPMPMDSPVRRRSSQRNISRFLRPDFYDTPSRDDSSSYIKDKKQREYETQAVLREIRERSRERSLDRRDKSTDRLGDRSYYSNIDSKSMRERRKSSIPNINHAPLDAVVTNHVRNKSVDRFCNLSDELLCQRTSLQQKNAQFVAHSTSTSRNVDATVEQSKCDDAILFTDTILGELQNQSINQTNTIGVTQIDPQELCANSKRDKCDDTAKKEKVTKVKKIKTKDVEEKMNVKDVEDVSINNVKMVTSLTNEIDSVTLPKFSSDKPKRLSKLARPKSYPIKEFEQQMVQKSQEKIDTIHENGVANTNKSVDNDSSCKPERPKSYPYSKITPPKEMAKFSKATGNDSMVTEKMSTKPVILKSASKSDKERSTETSSSENTVATVKKVKVLKKSIHSKIEPSLSTQSNDASSMDKQSPKPVEITTKEKSPDKKVGRGFLYSIGQKFERLREGSKSKDKKTVGKLTKISAADKVSESPTIEQTVESSKTIQNTVGGTVKQPSQVDTIRSIKKSKTTTTKTPNDSVVDTEKSTERKSRIDTMIRHLRERSLPRGPALTESGLIKRAVSVEDMTGGTFNRCTVNKVLGLFKKIEKDLQNDVNSAPENETATSNGKERPKSSGFVSKLKKTRPYLGAKSDTIITLTDQMQKQLDADKLNGNLVKLSVKQNSTCPNCIEENLSSKVVKRQLHGDTVDQASKDKERMRNHRKGLVLDLSRFEKPLNDIKNIGTGSNPNNYHSSNHANVVNNHNNNNNIQTATQKNSRIGMAIAANEQLTPSYESLTNYSSDSRSLHDDCASTSTFLSPTDEPELYFDDWSICSEDNFSGAHSTPSVSRLSRNSNGTSPLTGNNSNYNNAESVIDRIKRKSFYCRFNDNKSKRQYSSAAAPAAREYYREAAAKLKARPPERLNSPSMAEYPAKTDHHTHVRAHSIVGSGQLYNNTRSESNDTLKSQSKSSYEDDLKCYRPSEYMRSKTVNYNLPPTPSYTASSSTSLSSKSHQYSPTSSNDYSKYRNTDYFSLQPTSRNSVYDTTTPMYGTYNPNRRLSSYTANGTSTGSLITTVTPSGLNTTTTTSAYATLGRKSRPYDHRTISMLDSSSCNNSSGGYMFRRDSRGTADFGNITR